MPIISGSGGSGGAATGFASAIISASPPAAPVSGSIWVYPADDTNGVYWQFVYDSTQTTYKWRFVGGPPLTANAAPNNHINANTQVGATGNYYSCSISAARAGDYYIWGTAEFVYTASALANASATVQPFQGTTVSANAARGDNSTWAATNNVPWSAAGGGIMTGLGAATTCGMCVSGSDPGGITLRWQYTYLIPVRVI